MLSFKYLHLAVPFLSFLHMEIKVNFFAVPSKLNFVAVSLILLLTGPRPLNKFKQFFFRKQIDRHELGKLSMKSFQCVLVDFPGNQ